MVKVVLCCRVRKLGIIKMGGGDGFVWQEYDKLNTKSAIVLLPLRFNSYNI